MTVDTFKKLTELTGPIKYTSTLRESQFGDGYSQVADNGINSTVDEVPLKCAGTTTEMLAVEAFLLAHLVKAFIYAPPDHPAGMYRTVLDSVTYTKEGPTNASVVFSVKRAYGVYA